MYNPPCEVWRGLKVRVPFDVMMVVPLGTAPLEFFHTTKGEVSVFPHTLPMHRSEYV